MSETEQERLNRELIELLNELRVALPGVQVLFAFLLTAPFAKGFPKLDRFDRYVYFAALLSTVLASILLIAPSAYHRFVWRDHDKEDLLEVSNQLVIGGLAVLACAISCSVFVVTDFLFGTIAGAIVVSVTAGAFVGFWFVLPLSRRPRR